MPADPRLFDLLQRSIVVTGTHYSATTLIGALLATAPEFHLLHEPLNPQPTRSYDSLRPAHWYEYFDASRFEELSAGLQQMFARGHNLNEMLRRPAGARSLRELGRAARYAQRKWPFLACPKPAILKDPFLAFSAPTLQREAGLKVVLCVRHPGAFAESFLRKAGRFDFADLAAQHALLDQIPHEADQIRKFAATEQPAIAQAGLLWRTVYGFAAARYVADPRTIRIRQEDLVGDLAGEVARLFTFAEASQGGATLRFLGENFAEGPADHAAGSYIRRDPAQAAGKWRERLSPGDTLKLREMTGAVAHSYGYGEQSWPH